MNKCTRVIAVMAIMILLTGALYGCRNMKTDETMLSANTPDTTVGESTPTTQEATLPKGEGVENIDSITLPTQSNKADTVPTEPNNPYGDSNANNSEELTGATRPTDETDPTEDTKPTTGTEPTETTEPKDATDSAEDTQPGDGECCAYSAYLKMPAAEQQAYMNTFSSPLAFIEWCQGAEAEHKGHDDSIIVEGGDLDVGDYID